MLGYILKFLFLFITVMVTLNIFLPEDAHKVLLLLSEYTNINIEVLEKNLTLVTQFTLDTFFEVKEQILSLLSKD